MFRLFRILLGITQDIHHGTITQGRAQMSFDTGRAIVMSAHTLAGELQTHVILPVATLKGYTIKETGIELPLPVRFVAWPSVLGVGLQLAPLYDYQPDIDRMGHMGRSAKTVRVLEDYLLTLMLVRKGEPTIDIPVPAADSESAANFIALTMAYAQRLKIKYSELGLDKPIAQIVKRR